MDTIRVNTTQNVQLNYQPAGVGLRILAGLLDMIFAYAYMFIVVMLFVYFVFRRSRYDYDYVDERETYNAIMIGLLILCLLPGMLYHLLCETFLNGQSFGKKIVKIKVIRLDGTQPGFGSYLIRSLFRLIDVSLSPVVSIITIAASLKSQRFGDMAAGTTVIQLSKPITLKDTILHKLKSDYVIVYPQVAALSDQEANLIREVMVFATDPEQQKTHVRLLADKIKRKIGITDVKTSDDVFLKTILLDYSHYKFEN
ncbi:MAG: RDD family protein [Sediminibacterium sp.]|nr:RDD family protein [Sediminibacterium sp.]